MLMTSGHIEDIALCQKDTIEVCICDKIAMVTHSLPLKPELSTGIPGNTAVLTAKWKFSEENSFPYVS